MTSAEVTTQTRLLTKKEVAATLKVSPRTINRMVSIGELPKPMKRGAGNARNPDKLPCLWFLSDVTAYIEKMAATSR